MNYLELSVQQLEVFEGRIPWMYLDPKGNVTVGVGKMLPNLAAALALPFQVAELGRMQPARPEEIEDSWNRVSAIGKGKVAGAYNWPGAVFLEDAAIDALLLSTVTAIDAGLPRLYPDYPSWPAAAKLAVLDMDYNLGQGPTGLGDYHHMNSALNHTPPRFDLASEMCGRDVADPAFEKRNTWTISQFVAAQAV